MKLINPKPLKIHEGSTEVTQSANVANQMTVVASILVPDSKVYAIRTGVVMNGQFKTSGDAALADGSEIVLAYKKPGDDIWKPIPGAKLLMGGFNNVTKANQQNKENDAPRTFTIANGKGYEAFAEGDTIGILVKSATVVSYTYSFFVLPLTSYDKR